MQSPPITAEEQAALDALERRLGRVLLGQRLGLERDHEAQVFRAGTHVFHLENWYSFHGLIRSGLRLAGLHGRGRRNALAFDVRRNDVVLPRLPAPFDGLTVLQLSDLHVDMNDRFVDALIQCVASLDYQVCVLTGDYRARTYGPFGATLDGLRRLREHLRPPVYAVLGNHDTIRLVPGMEAAGYRLLMNESVALARGGTALHLAGIDDAHYYRTDSIDRAAAAIPSAAAAILLSHTPEAYRHAAHAGFDLMLCGHTHGGQICLPGGIPILTDADSPRAFARGPWRYHGMAGYTSVGAGTSIVDVRFNCPPEVTLHRLRCG